MGWHGGRDGLVEIWNGMPFFSPMWARTPHITFLHHIHGVMWDMTLPPRLASAGRFIESRLAPPAYHFTPIVTLSESSKHELVEELHFKSSRVTVVPPGIDQRFSPGGTRADRPLVVAVGRLVPVKRFDLLIDALVEAKQNVPELRAVIVGEGYERESLEARLRDTRADEWISLTGHLTDQELVDLYRSAWVIASASAREGWGMTLTEAAACGTPAVATRIAGHLDAVVDGQTGLLTGERRDDLSAALARVLGDHDLRGRLSAGARDHAARYTWGATALGTLDVLAREAIRLRGRR
jgi:glycosyltransferase involved in cell wall biosynthesis